MGVPLLGATTRSYSKFMLLNTTDLCGNEVAALDGDVGTVKDFYFDDKHWVIRYVVADTGSWLLGRLVLLSPNSLGDVDLPGGLLHVKLDRRQIQDSPAINSHITISRDYEMDYFRYYGLPVYWPAGALAGSGTNPPFVPRPRGGSEVPLPRRCGEDRHLQSTKAVTGFQIKALDGIVGHVNGFFVDDRSWSIPGLVVEAGHWYSEKEILISAENIDRINYEESTVLVNLSRADIQRTPETDVAKVTFGENGRNHFHD